MKNISLLGSTGSIGVNVLSIAQMHPDRFCVKALACGANVELLAAQTLQFRPELSVVQDEKLALELKKRLPADTKTEIMYGPEGYHAAASFGESDMVVSAIVGAAGLLPTLAAIEAGKDVALANKESLVVAGDLVMARAREKGVRITPVDSEHSAIFQCLQGQREVDVAHLLLTASGGPFRTRPAGEFKSIVPGDALNHPTWQMGRKISIDSATLMNKGLEVIEAMHLFSVSWDRIKVVVHPQSIVHSMVSFVDGSVLAQMGLPDMKGAIAYAMTYPERIDIEHPAPDFAKLKSLDFEDPDLKRFPCLSLAFDAAREGRTMPAVMNAANEMAVYAFLEGRIAFAQIAELIRRAMDAHVPVASARLDDVLHADAWARRKTVENMDNLV